MWPFQKHAKSDAAGDAPPSEAVDAVTPPVDLNTPVTNPDLKAALSRLAEAPTADTQKALWLQLNRANYLVVFNPDELRTTPGAAEGQVTIEGGSLLKVLTCHAPDGKLLLPAFTDWDEANAFAGGATISGLVMPSQQLWEFILAGPYAGAVINPAGLPLPLSRELLQGLKDAA